MDNITEKGKEITKQSVQDLMVKIALDQQHKGTGTEHLRNLATCMEVLKADTIEKKFQVIAFFNKNASQYSQNIERWKNPVEEVEAQAQVGSYEKYL